MMRFIYTKDMLQFIQDNCNGNSNRQLARLFSDRFEIDVTEKQIKYVMSNHKIKRLERGKPDWVDEYIAKMYPPDVAGFIRDNHIGINQKRMAEMLNERFEKYGHYTHSMMKYYYRKMGYCSGLTGRFSADDPRCIANRFKKGNHYSTGTEFKKGNRPHNAVPVGTIVKQTDGWLAKKIAEPNKWKHLHRLIWEEAHGPIPNEMVIIFLDGNKDNCNLENLAMISKQEHSIMNHKKYRFENADVTKLGLMTVRLNKRVKELKNGK